VRSIVTKERRKLFSEVLDERFEVVGIWAVPAREASDIECSRICGGALLFAEIEEITEALERFGLFGVRMAIDAREPAGEGVGESALPRGHRTQIEIVE